MQRVLSCLFLCVALVGASCSGSPDGGSAAPRLVDPDQAVGTDSDGAADAASTTVPEGLAFADDGPRLLRVSVPRLEFFAPHLVDETDPVAVLVADLLTDGLTERDPVGGYPLPGLAESWTVSIDRLVWTFVLGETQFSTGAPVTADDVVASLNRVAAQGVASLSGPNLWAIDGWELAGENGFAGADSSETGSDFLVAGIVAIDERTVEITVTEPFEPLPEVLAGVAFGIMPAGDAAVGLLPVSSSRRFEPTALWEDGFRVAGEQIDGEISTIEILVDPHRTLLAAGEADLGIAIDPSSAPGDLRGSAVQRSADVFYAMNAGLAPFDDVMIRQAIVHAIDRHDVQEQFFPGTGAMTSFVPQEVPGGVADACGANCDFDPDQARLLVQASPSREIPVTIDYFVADGDGDSEQRLAEYIASALRDVGLIATARSHAAADYGIRAADGELGLFRFGSVSTTLTAEADLGAMFHSNGRDNISSTSIALFDAQIESARREQDPVIRSAMYEEAERMLFGEAVVLPLVEFRHYLRFSPLIESASLEPDGSLDLDSIVFATPN